MNKIAVLSILAVISTSYPLHADGIRPIGPHRPGIYLSTDATNPTELVAIEPMAGIQRSSGDPDSTAFTVEIPNAHARTETTEARPTFYFFVNPAIHISLAEFSLVKFAARSRQRKANYGTFKASSTHTSIGMPFRVNNVGAGVYEVRPENALRPGEYGFVCDFSLATGAAEILNVFDFSVSKPAT